MEQEKLITFVAGERSDFAAYQRQHPQKNCELIVDVTTLQGRNPGEIIVLDSVQYLWNYVGIMESIERFEAKHREYFSQMEGKQEAKELELSDDDLKLGV